jgi:hypothetical protein
LPGGALPATARVVPRQLPADTDTFTSRDAALKRLDRLLDDQDKSTPRPVVISAIADTAGIGKTALAVHWAHRVADRFPDGHLYVDLRGFDPSGSSPASSSVSSTSPPPTRSAPDSTASTSPPPKPSSTRG